MAALLKNLVFQQRWSVLGLSWDLRQQASRERIVTGTRVMVVEVDSEPCLNIWRKNWRVNEMRGAS